MQVEIRFPSKLYYKMVTDGDMVTKFESSYIFAVANWVQEG